MAVKFVNNYSTNLSSSITGGQTTMIVDDVTGLPTISGSDYMYLTLSNALGTAIEIVKVTGISGNTLTITRAQDNTSALSWQVGTIVEGRINAALLTDITTNVNGNLSVNGVISSTAPEAALQLTTTGQKSYSLISGGGGNLANGYFAIRNNTNGNNPFYIDPNAPANAVYISSTGLSVNGAVTTTGNISNGYLNFRTDAIEIPSGDNDDAAVVFNFLGYNNGSTRFRDFKVFNGKGSLGLFYDASANSFAVTGAVTATSGSDAVRGITLVGAGPSQGSLRFGSSNDEYKISGGADYLGVIYDTSAAYSHTFKVGGTTSGVFSSSGLTVNGDASSQNGNNSGVARSWISSWADDINGGRGGWGINAYPTKTNYSNGLTRPDTGQSGWAWHGRTTNAAYESNDWIMLSRVTAGGTKWDYLTLDASGNLGLGVTPSAWGANITALDMPSGASIFSGAYLSSLGTIVGNNVYNNAGNKYKENGYATQYVMLGADGSHRWYTAPTGTAGNPITFTQAMTLDASGNLLVGRAAGRQNSGRLEVKADTSEQAIVAQVRTDANSVFQGFNSSGQMCFLVTGSGILSVAQSGTTALSLDASGNLGLGVTPTNGKLHVHSGTGDGATYDTVFALSRTSSTGNVLSYKLVLDDKDTNSANLVFRSKTTASGSESGAYYTDVMTLDASGNLIVADTTAYGNISTTGDLAAKNCFAGKNSGTTYGSSSWFARWINSSNATAGSIQHTAATTVNYNTASDKRLKRSLNVCEDTSVIDNTVVHDFEWVQDGHVDRGVFAQDAYEFNKRAVSVGSDDLTEDGSLENPWSVDYSKYVPDLIVYCQQLKKQVAALESRLAALESK